jgi:tRNA-dihydrouridine synthase
MAGVTDRPFRQLCKRLGAGYAVSEMVTSRRDLWDTLKTSRRANHEGEPGPIAVQIAGTEAQMMADAAVYNIARGAQIIDINMGCPAKKVCNKCPVHRGGGRGGLYAAPGSRDAEDAHRLVSEPQERRRAGACL